jgi:hypothetical protein
VPVCRPKRAFGSRCIEQHYDLGTCAHDARLWENKPVHNRHTAVKKIPNGILSNQLGIRCFAGRLGLVNAPAG